MQNKLMKQLLFFVACFLLFILLANPRYWMEKLGVGEKQGVVVSAILYTLGIALVYYVSGIDNSSSEGFWDVSPFAQCRGGPYMHSGSSENAEMCREMASTPEGRMGIASYQCGLGQNGIPKLPFIYTPLSDDNWKNERCQKEPCLPSLTDNGGSTCSQSTNYIN